MDVFLVIADPTRRKMLEMMRGGELAAGTFVAAFPEVSQPAISQHLKVLRRAALVEVRAEKQRRFYRLLPHRLGPVSEWVGGFETIDQASKPATKRSERKTSAQPRRAEAAATLDLFG